MWGVQDREALCRKGHSLSSGSVPRAQYWQGKHCFICTKCDRERGARYRERLRERRNGHQTSPVFKECTVSFLNSVLKRRKVLAPGR